MFPKKYERYIEPFGGSGAVLLGKKVADDYEVYNDYNHNLVNLFKCIRDRPMGLIRELGFMNLNSRDDFNVYKKFCNGEVFDEQFMKEEMELSKILLKENEANEYIELMTRRTLDYDLKRASMFLKLLRYSYSSSGKSFAGQPFDIRSLFGLIQEMSERIAKLIIENQDFSELIPHYDRKNAFFYCDPPYISSEHFYNCGFNMESHKKLRELLINIQGYFLLSYNDCSTVREMYKDFPKYSFKRVHSMAQRYEAGKEFPEILIANYDLTQKVKEAPMQLSLFGDESEIMDIKKIIKEGFIL